MRQAVERDLQQAALGPGAAAAHHFRTERDGWWDGYAYEIDPAFTPLHAAVQARRIALAGASGRNT
jgi:hypothetical protein